MKQLHDEQEYESGLECEFIPPIGLGPEVIDVSWEVRVSAEIAWQEAGGYDCGEYLPPAAESVAAVDRTLRIVPETGVSPSALSMGTITRMNTLAVALRAQLLRIQNEAANVAIAEMSLRQRAADADAAPLPELHDANALRLEGVVKEWFALIDSARAEMSAISGLGQEAAPRSGRGRQERVSMSFIERRRQTVMIDFPDRRQA